MSFAENLNDVTQLQKNEVCMTFSFIVCVLSSNTLLHTTVCVIILLLHGYSK